MTKTYKASIVYDTDANHPDAPSRNGLEFTDTYTIDCNYYDAEAARSYIRRDLALVAGGGYDTDHITNIAINIIQI